MTSSVPVTFTELVELAHEKNSTMLACPERPLYKSLLQKKMWNQLQTTFVHANDKVALVTSPINTVTPCYVPVAQKTSPLARRSQRRSTKSPTAREAHTNPIASKQARRQCHASGPFAHSAQSQRNVPREAYGFRRGAAAL